MAPLCPYCGTEAQDPPGGSLPHTWRCPNCGQEVDLPQSPLSGPPEAGPPLEVPPPPPPPPAGDQAAAAGSGPAWEEEGVPLLSGLWRTVWQVLLHPVRTFQAPARLEMGPPFSFGLILGTLGAAAQAFWSHLQGDDSALWLIFLAPLVTGISLFLNPALVQMFLRLVGGGRRGYKATFRVMAYANAGGIFYLVPKVGIAVGAVWSLVVTVAGLAATHGVSRWRPFWALVLMVFAVAVVVFLFAMALVGIGAVQALSPKDGGLPF